MEKILEILVAFVDFLTKVLPSLADLVLVLKNASSLGILTGNQG